ncbi:3692_t:CDS:2 [Racocetra persica]|uniref:3692_t:CDS:1 n=1 Tax=Racocetra persica TaxID=160502 RepID=A0ACA9L3V9_9GLOM|nr:3692_t:CDS:2 [Racocetra persica]
MSLTEVPSVLDLYTFNMTSPRGNKLSKSYQILPKDCRNRNQVREGNVKTIILVDEHAKQLSILTFVYAKYLGCFARVCSIIDKYEGESTVISKQYSIKNAQDPKEQAVLLGIASTIILVLLTKYPDLLAVDSTGHCNSLNFSNTVFMVRSDELHGRVVATFVSDKETILVTDLIFESLIKYSSKNGIQLNPKWLAIDK